MIDPEFRDVKTRSAISTLYNFTMRQSYVGALIIMMVSTLLCNNYDVCKTLALKTGCKDVNSYMVERIALRKFETLYPYI